MRLPRVLLAATIPLLPGLALVAPTADAAQSAAGAKPRYQEYVALGDSWSADVTILDTAGLPATEHAPLGCAQSRQNYPRLVAKSLGVAVLRDATCGSATTDHFWGPQADLPTGETNAPQFDRLTPTTDLVTIGIGGNDAGFAGGALSCLTPLPDPAVVPGLPDVAGCEDTFTAGGVDQLAKSIAATKPKIVAAIKEVKRRSPHARILVVDYLNGIPAHGCWPLVPIHDDMAYLYRTFKKLNAMVAAAAKQGGAELVNTYAATAGHDICQPPNRRYVEGLGIVSLNGVSVAIPAHPNSAGAAAQARLVLRKIRG